MEGVSGSGAASARVALKGATRGGRHGSCIQFKEFSNDPYISIRRFCKISICAFKNKGTYVYRLCKQILSLVLL
jgi:hypothetical protein